MLTGTPSVFVRASGCNLRCWFCDTPYTSWQPEGEDVSVDEIVRRIAEATDASSLTSDLRPLTSDLRPPISSLQPPACRLSHAVITGGEPMLFAELIPLSQRLREAGLHITIETAGTLNLPVECDLMSISPKLSNSTPPSDRDARWHRRHEQSRHAPEVIRWLVGEYLYQIKFVIDRPADCEEVEAYLDEFPKIDRSRVLLMPQGTDPIELAERREWLEPLCRQRGYVFCPRRHIEWYGHKRGT